MPPAKERFYKNPQEHTALKIDVPNVVIAHI